MVLKKGNFDSLPIWVRLHSIPYELWSKAGIGAIASAIGKPLYVDLQTEQLRMISFARVCVQVSAAKPLCDSVKVEIRDELISIPVEYDWKPVVCLKCGVFGHKCAEATSNALAQPALGSTPGKGSDIPGEISDLPGAGYDVPASQDANEGWKTVGKVRKAKGVAGEKRAYVDKRRGSLATVVVAEPSDEQLMDVVLTSTDDIEQHIQAGSSGLTGARRKPAVVNSSSLPPTAPIDGGQPEMGNPPQSTTADTSMRSGGKRNLKADIVKPTPAIVETQPRSSSAAAERMFVTSQNFKICKNK